MAKTRVLVIDDSALVRKMLTAILESDDGIEVVGTASDPFIARDKIKELEPDVLTLDVEMPRMDGVTFLRNLMRLHPMPVVMVSTLTTRGAAVTFDSLALGAVDFVAKPTSDLAHTMDDVAAEILAKVKGAAKACVRNLGKAPTKPVTSRLQFRTTEHLIAIGASTGGTEAIKEVVVALPADSPGIVVTQHIPAAFSEAFAERLDGLAAMTVRQAADGDQILPGHVLIAPGGRHLEVRRSGARFHCRVHDEPPVNRHRPSVDVLFDSVASTAGHNAVGVLLTGMGADGAAGLLRMREAGAHTIAQDEATSVVWGMPGSAVELDAAVDVLPLGDVANALIEFEPSTSAGRR